MKTCCCQLAGTKACETCGNNQWGMSNDHVTLKIYTVTKEDLRKSQIKNIDEQIKKLQREKQLLEMGIDPTPQWLM